MGPIVAAPWCPFAAGQRSLGYWTIPLWLAFAMTPAHAERSVGSESVVKVALLYKLTQFVSWPDDPDSHTGVEFYFCAVGAESIENALAEIEGRKVGNKTIVVNHLTSQSGLDRCDSLYFADSGNLRAVDAYLARVRGRPVLTIGDVDGFAELGGMIEIARRQRRLAFRINVAAARIEGIRIAAPLLELSSVIRQ